MPLGEFLDNVDAPERSLTVRNRTEPEWLRVMLEELFDVQDVSVVEDTNASVRANL